MLPVEAAITKNDALMVSRVRRPSRARTDLQVDRALMSGAFNAPMSLVSASALPLQCGFC